MFRRNKLRCDWGLFLIIFHSPDLLPLLPSASIDPTHARLRNRFIASMYAPRCWDLTPTYKAERFRIIFCLDIQHKTW